MLHKDEQGVEKVRFNDDEEQMTEESRAVFFDNQDSHPPLCCSTLQDQSHPVLLCPRSR